MRVHREEFASNLETGRYRRMASGSVSLSALRKIPLKEDEELKQVRDFSSLTSAVGDAAAKESSAATP